MSDQPDYKALYEKQKRKVINYCKVIKKQQENSKKLKEENEKLNKILKASHKTDKENIDLKRKIQFYKDENKELKELTEGIMEYEHTSFILGINCYEKFINLSAELDYSEKTIKELKEENKRLEKQYKSDQEYIDKFESKCNKVVKYNKLFKKLELDEKFIEEGLKMNDTVDIQLYKTYDILKQLNDELRATKQIVWEQEKIEKMGVETYIKRQSLKGNIPEYKLITHDEPSEHHQASSNELHIYEATGYEGEAPIQMTWDYTNEILDEFFSDHYSINDIYNHYCLDMRWVEFIKEKWGWKSGTKLRFNTKTNSDGYMNFWKKDDDMRCDYMIDENGVFCSYFYHKYYSDNQYVPINCAYNQNLKDIKEDLRKKEDIEKLKEYRTMIYCVWSDLYWADKGSCEVSFKDISQSCDYYENEEFIKKEVIDEEEEEEEEYMYDVKNDDTTYYLGDSLDEARKHAQGRGLEIWRYIVEDGNTNFDNWDIVE